MHGGLQSLHHWIPSIQPARGQHQLRVPERGDGRQLGHSLPRLPQSRAAVANQIPSRHSGWVVSICAQSIFRCALLLDGSDILHQQRVHSARALPDRAVRSLHLHHRDCAADLQSIR